MKGTARKLKAIKLTKEYLVSNFPNDILMPVKQDTKHPEYAHKNGTWTWSQFNAALEKNPQCDICILLCDLCVIDVDSMDIASELEHRFPILLTVPTEKTQKGCHYWFERSVKANEEGFYDGAAQRRVGIDFKTICQTGTSGVVVVAPSTNKHWLRRPWEYAMSIIPDDLLEAVAVPRHKVINATLSFECGETLHIKTCRFLHTMPYFEPLVNEDVNLNKTFPVPCQRKVFQDLMHVFEHNEIYSKEQTPTTLRELLIVGDMLGVPERIMRRLQCGLPRFYLDIKDVSNEWSESRIAEKRCQHNGCHNNDILIDVNGSTKELLLYVPVDQHDDERWLMYDKQSTKIDQTTDHKQIKSGMPVLTFDPNDIGKNLPLQVNWILKAYPGRIVMAGGAALGALSHFVKPGSDYDLFVVDMNESDASEVVSTICDTFHSCTSIFKTEFAVTLIFDNNVTVQIIMRLHGNIAQVLLGFDMAPCKAAIFYDGCKYVAHATPLWVASMRHLAFPMDFNMWSKSSIVRAFKYHHKGFGIFIPGCRRSAIRLGTNHNKLKSDLQGLYEMEAKLLRSRQGYFYPIKRITGPVSSAELRVCVAHCKHTCDYTSLVKFQGRLSYAISRIINYIWPRGGTHAVVKKITEGALFWHRCNPLQTSMGTFNPENPYIGRAYDMDKLASILNADVNAQYATSNT